MADTAAPLAEGTAEWVPEDTEAIRREAAVDSAEECWADCSGALRVAGCLTNSAGGRLHPPHTIKGIPLLLLRTRARDSRDPAGASMIAVAVAEGVEAGISAEAATRVASQAEASESVIDTQPVPMA
jgi:hypothetical protein